MSFFKSIYTILLIIVLTVSVKAQNWTIIDTSITHTYSSLNAAYFTNDTTGYVVGTKSDGSGGVILKTTNAGASWTLQNVNYGLLSVYFPSKDTGYAVGYHCTIMKTINAGATWTYQNSVVSILYWAKAVTFINNDTGFVSCINGPGYAFLKTYDGGMNWINEVTDTVFANAFCRTNSGIIFGIKNELYKTSDNGVTWTRNAIPPYSTVPPYSTSSSVCFVNDSIGFATLFKADGVSPCINYSSLIKTTNGGQSWIETNYNCAYVGALAFPSDKIGYMLGSPSGFFKTKDQGDTWNFSPLPYDSTQLANYVSSYFIICTDTSTCYVLNNDGTIFKTTNGGGAVGIQEQARINDDLILYPNPASGQITFEISDALKENTTIYIKNILAQTIKTYLLPKGNKQLQLDVSDLSKGLYFVQLQNGDKMITKKFIKE